MRSIFHWGHLGLEIIHPVEYLLFIPRSIGFSPELDSGLKLGFISPFMKGANLVEQ
ncbi:hypothetical protein KAT67_04075 [candidate division WOR-3 bacterium]|nr:hypothetical protein [candidate division WOR-3 bacterium]